MSKSHINHLFDSAVAQGALSPESLGALTVTDLGQDIQSALGISVDDVTASEVVLVTLMPDDSGSISQAGNATLVREGHNGVLDALQNSAKVDSILVHTRYLNGYVLQPYAPLPSAQRLDTQNYDPALGTPLYDQAVVLLGTVLAKAQEFLDAGVSVRTVTLLITDGGDCGSTQHKARDVASLVADLLGQERHIVAALGIDDGSTDFRRVFKEMGIEDRWILTPKNDKTEIRRAFQLFSQSAIKASSGSLGGFGA
jgi:hypothetical protein